MSNEHLEGYTLAAKMVANTKKAIGWAKGKGYAKKILRITPCRDYPTLIWNDHYRGTTDAFLDSVGC